MGNSQFLCSLHDETTTIEDIVNAVALESGKLEERKNVCGEQGCTPLIAASLRGKTDIVACLLLYKVDVNAVTQGGRTALMCACYDGRAAIVAMLLHAGADANILGKRGETASYLARLKGFKTIEDLVKKYEDYPTPFVYNRPYLLDMTQIEGDAMRVEVNSGRLFDFVMEDLMRTRGRFTVHNAQAKMQPVNDINVVSIEAIRPQDLAQSAFEQRMGQLFGWGGSLPLFKFDESRLDIAQKNVYQVLDNCMCRKQIYAAATYPRVVYAFHGTRAEFVDGICNFGLANVKTTAGGYFGSGVYTTLNLEYAARYATGEMMGQQRNGRLLDNAVPVILFAVAISNCYPITDADYDPGIASAEGRPNHSNFYGKALNTGSDTHFALVSDEFHNGGSEACGNITDPHFIYAEIVSEKTESLFPIAVLWVTRRQPENAGGDEGRAGGDEGRAGGDEGRAGGDEGRAGGDEGKAGGDEGKAGGDEGKAGGDEGRAGGDEGKAGGDEGKAVEDERKAEGDEEEAERDE